MAELIYEGDSPDETALLDGLRACDILFTTKTPKGMVLKFFGVDETFEILKIIEFNSTRKRMSMIVRNPEGACLIILLLLFVGLKFIFIYFIFCLCRSNRALL